MQNRNEVNIHALRGEYEGKTVIFEGNALQLILENNLKLATDAQDFVNKVTYQITDRTSFLDTYDQWALEQYFVSCK